MWKFTPSPMGLHIGALARAEWARKGRFGMLVRRYYFRGSWPQFIRE
jgi:hypothetical protein